MKSNAENLEAYLADILDARLGALKTIKELCQKHLPGYEETMAYNMPSYKKDDDVEVAFASQKIIFAFILLSMT